MESGDYWSDSAAHVPSVVLAATVSARLSWSTEDELTFEEWFADGALFEERDPGWAIGDWLSYGVAHFDNCYGAAAQATGLAPQTLMHMAAVAEQFAPDQRRDGLSLDVHAVVAELDPDSQEDWLELAREQHLNARQLQAQVNAFGRENLYERRATERRATERRGAERRRQTDRRTAPERSSESLSAYDAAATSGERVVTCPHCGEHFVA